MDGGSGLERGGRGANPQKKENLQIFAREVNLKGARVFIVSEPSEFWRAYAALAAHTPHRRHYYEVLLEGQPCRLYMDLEFKVNASLSTSNLSNLSANNLSNLSAARLSTSSTHAAASACEATADAAHSSLSASNPSGNLSNPSANLSNLGASSLRTSSTSSASSTAASAFACAVPASACDAPPEMAAAVQRGDRLGAHFTCFYWYKSTHTDT